MFDLDIIFVIRFRYYMQVAYVRVMKTLPFWLYIELFIGAWSICL